MRRKYRCTAQLKRFGMALVISTTLHKKGNCSLRAQEEGNEDAEDA